MPKITERPIYFSGREHATGGDRRRRRRGKETTAGKKEQITKAEEILLRRLVPEMAAMAAIRHAGRRLVGGVRLAQAPSRPVSTTPAGLGRPDFTQNFQSHGSEKANLLMQVQQKKELLYNLICEHGCEVNGKICLPNIELLRHLSAQVKPRPSDLAWCFLRLTHTAYVACMCASPVVTLYGSWIVFKTTRDRLRGEEN